MERHLLVCGHGRSGSTLFYNMLRHTLQGFGMFDSEVTAETVIGRPGSHCSKRPYDIFRVPQILQRNVGRKQLDLVVMLRDPRNLLVSRHTAVPDDYFMGADHAYLVLPDRTPTPTAPGILQIHKAIMEVTASGLVPQGIFFLKYEDLTAHPEDVKTLLAQQMDLRFEGRFADFHKGTIPDELHGPLNGVRAVEAGQGRKWAAPRHRDRIIDQFTRFPVLHELVIQLGYEKDRGWFDALLEEGAPAPAEG